MDEYLQLNGVPLRGVDPGLLRAIGYAHFTVMQVRDGRTPGLNLHLDRLDRSSRELFGQGPARDRIRHELRTALDGAGVVDATVRVVAFTQRPADALRGVPVEPDLLVKVSPPVPPTEEPPRLLAIEHERPAPHLKHTGTFDLLYHARQARLAGYDDVLFHTAAGLISEASIWNICFARDSELVWPDAPALAGVMLQVVQHGLTATGTPFATRAVHLDDLSRYDAAYLTNSSDAALPIASITSPAGTIDYAPDPVSAKLLRQAHDAVPAQSI